MPSRFLFCLIFFSLSAVCAEDTADKIPRLKAGNPGYEFEFLGKSAKGIEFWLDRQSGLVWSDLITRNSGLKSQKEAKNLCSNADLYLQQTDALPPGLHIKKNALFLPCKAAIERGRVHGYYKALLETKNLNDCYKDDCFPNARGEIECHTGCNYFNVWTASKESLSDSMNLVFFTLSGFAGRSITYIDAKSGYMITNGSQKYHVRCLIRWDPANKICL